MLKKRLISVRLYIFLFITGLLAKEYSALIQNDVAIFYPDNFSAEKHLPSFALLKEPAEIGPLPESWKTRVHFSRLLKRSVAVIEIETGTDLYGTGEVTGRLVRNGTSRKLWNTDNYGYKRDNDQRLYQTHPWVLGVRRDGTSFGVLADNTWRQEISLGDNILFQSDSPPFRVIVIEKKSPQEVVQTLAELTGKMALPPLWSLGYQQCRWSYYPDTRVKEIADTFRVKQIPCDVIWMDIHYMDGYRVFTFSPEYFPNPNETNDYLHQLGYKSVWMIDPGVKYEAGYLVYDSGTEKDVWVKSADGKDYIGPVWPGDCVFPDFTQAKTATWWAGLYQNFMATGIDGVWNDMNEPAVFGTPDWTMPLDNVHQGDDRIKKDIHARYHNVYGMLMVKASRVGILKANPKKRPFVLTRANYIGGQRYAATWTGDNISSWKHLKMSVPMSLNLGLSGQPFNGPDIGGFGDNATPELFGHWIALGAFYPFSRGHTRRGSIHHEPWAFGPEIEKVSRIALQRRYRLMPYLYTLFYESSVNGLPVMRPVFFADYQDINLRKEDEAFLLGSDLLVIPQWAENPAFPEGNWRPISLVGEADQNDLYQPELCMRPGSILPLGKIIQNTTEYTLDTLTLYVSLDQNSRAAGTLYHDAGDGYGYQNGEYVLMSFKAGRRGNTIIIDTETKGQYSSDTKVLEVCLITDQGITRITKQFLNSVEIDF